MPTGPVELHEKWSNIGPHSGDVNAEDYLYKRGYKLTRRYTWITPEGHTPTEEECEAVSYLILEWDYCGFERGPD